MSSRFPGSLPAGKEKTVLSESPTTAGSKVIELGLDADSIIVSLFVSSLAVSGTLDLKVEAVGGDNLGTIIEFPQQIAVSTELIFRKAPYSLDRIKVTASYSDAVTYEVRVRGAKTDTAKVVENSTGTFLMGAPERTDWIDVTNLNFGAFEVSWTGVDATDGTLIMEGSNIDDLLGTEGEFGGNEGGVVIDSTDDDTQIFVFTSFTTKYIRLAYTRNNNTTGTAAWNFEGKS